MVGRFIRDVVLVTALMATGIVSVHSAEASKPYKIAQSSCPYYVILGCFGPLYEANQRSSAIGGRVIDTNQVSGFRNGYYCVVDGPHDRKSYANTLRQSWLGTVHDAYVKRGCEY